MIGLLFALLLAVPAEVTAYTHTGDRTASGRWPEVGVTAACRRDVPLGTWVLIETVGPRRCDDRIGRGTDFDVFVDTRQEAIRFGRREVRVAVR